MLHVAGRSGKRNKGTGNSVVVIWKMIRYKTARMILLIRADFFIYCPYTNFINTPYIQLPAIWRPSPLPDFSSLRCNLLISAINLHLM